MLNLQVTAINYSQLINVYCISDECLTEWYSFVVYSQLADRTMLYSIISEQPNFSYRCVLNFSVKILGSFDSLYVHRALILFIAILILFMLLSLKGNGI